MNNKIPIFPLSNVIFFPETDLPLNMSLKNEKLIGIVQPKTEADLYSIGCLGKITSFTETEDKRYIINLRGISKFKIIEEIENEYLFREFKVEYLDKEIEKNYQEKLKTNLINSEFDINQLKKFLRKRGFSLNWKQVDNMDFKNIVNALCMIMPITVNEKQTLLETENITERFEILKNIIDLDLLDKFKNRTIQ